MRGQNSTHAPKPRCLNWLFPHLLSQGCEGGEQGFHTLSIILRNVTLHFKPHRAIYPTLERRIEKGYSATVVKPKINVSSGATTFRDFSGKILKNGHLGNKA